MSLINDALKKAQKQRTGEAPPLASMPSVGGESPQRIARRAKPAGFNTLMVRAGIGGAVVLVLAIGGFFLFRDKPAAGGSVSTPTASVPSAAPQAASPTPTASQPATPAFTLPTAPKTEPVAAQPAQVVVRTESAKQPASVPSTTPPKASVPQPSALSPQPSAPAAPPPKLEPRAIQFIDNIKVAGIRASATDAKVLMNDRVYRIGSVVDADLGLKLVEISANALTFEDDRGGRYTRTF